KPATRRSRDDLPEPLGPVTSSASPAQTVKPTPLKTCRPPLTQVRSDPTSSIMGQPPACLHDPVALPRLRWLGPARPLLARQSEKTVIPCACLWRASIFWNGAKQDPISHRPAPPINPRWPSDR